jgi:hypothetical protein
MLLGWLQTRKLPDASLRMACLSTLFAITSWGALTSIGNEPVVQQPGSIYEEDEENEADNWEADDGDGEVQVSDAGSDGDDMERS